MAAFHQKDDWEWTLEERQDRPSPLRRLRNLLSRMQEQTRRVDRQLSEFRAQAEDAVRHPAKRLEHVNMRTNHFPFDGETRCHDTLWDHVSGPIRRTPVASTALQRNHARRHLTDAFVQASAKHNLRSTANDRRCPTSPDPVAHVATGSLSQAILTATARTIAMLALWAFLLTQSARPAPIVVYVDCSGSMAVNGKAHAAQEGTKLIAAMTEEGSNMVIVPFNESAVVGRFVIPRDRDAAMKWVDSFRIDGNTNYLAALQTADLPADAAGVFLSDGGHNTGGPSSAVLDYLKTHAKGRLHTIAVGCPPGSPAETLLTQMAAFTGGGFTRAESSEELVRTMLALAVRLGRYRSYRPDQDTIQFRASQGRILAFGYDGLPDLLINPPLSSPPYRHHADLPGQKVDLAAVDLAQPADVILRLSQKRTPIAKLGDVHRSDLPGAHVEIENQHGQVPVSDLLKTTVRFTDRNGRTVPASHDLSAEVQILSPSQKILDSAVATPAADRTRYEAQLRLPSQPGPIMVRAKTTVKTPEGQTFTAADERTVIVADAHPLAVAPSPLRASGKVGLLRCELEVHIPKAPSAVATFTAGLSHDVPNLRLLQSRTGAHKVILDFETTAPGTYRGSLTVRANADVLTKTADVPFVLTIESPVRGLALPATRDIDLGTTLAMSGPTETTLRVPSLDDDPQAYQVEGRDLAGSAAAIPLRVAPSLIRPTKAAPAELKMAFNVDDIPAGVYKGAIVVKSATAADHPPWQTTLCLTVSEPLSARPLDAGKVEVGTIVTRTFLVKNLATRGLDNVTVTPPAVLKGANDQTRDIAVRLPGAVGILGPGQEKPVEVKIAVSPLVQLRGRLEGELLVRRGEVLGLRVPLSLDVVPEGAGGTNGLLVLPERLDLTSPPGDVAQAMLRVKRTGQESRTDELDASASPFRDPRGTPLDITTAFQWPEGPTLRPNAAVSLKAFVIAPKTPGTFQATISVRSKQGGTRTIPITLHVQ